MQSIAKKIFFALLCGVVVACSAIAVHYVLQRFGNDNLYVAVIVDCLGGLVAAFVFLAVHLRYEGMYYRFSMERAVIVAELNHHVRNAIFPLCLAVQAQSGTEANRLANDAVDRINMALRDALTDAIGQKLLHKTASQRNAASATR